MTELDELIRSVKNQQEAIGKIIGVFHDHDLDREQIRWVLEYLLRILDNDPR